MAIYKNKGKVEIIYYGSLPILALYRGANPIKFKKDTINPVNPTEPDEPTTGLLISCFANGYWIDEYPWTDEYPWKDYPDNV